LNNPKVPFSEYGMQMYLDGQDGGFEADVDLLEK
jgi:hypothetical protein